MDKGKDGGIGTDTQSDGENDRGGESGRFLKLSEGEFEVRHG